MRKVPIFCLTAGGVVRRGVFTGGDDHLVVWLVSESEAHGSPGNGIDGASVFVAL